MKNKTTNNFDTEQFFGNLCIGETATHGEACVDEIHLRGWAVHCECDCHSQIELPHGCADLDTFNTIFGGGRSEFPR